MGELDTDSHVAATWRGARNDARACSSDVPIRSLVVRSQNLGSPSFRTVMSLRLHCRLTPTSFFSVNRPSASRIRPSRYHRQTMIILVTRAWSKATGDATRHRANLRCGIVSYEFNVDQGAVVSSSRERERCATIVALSVGSIVN